MKVFARIVGVVLMLAALGIIVAGFVVRSRATEVLRTLDGEYAHESLSAEVTVTRDDWGVPHIVAENAHDASFGYGFTVAQDRLFQLEVLRRLGRGELAEILGPGAVSLDKVSRVLMWQKTGEKLLADRDVYSAEFNESLDGFIEGLNYYLETQPLPIEFEILGFEPRPFTAADSMSLMGYMAYGFAEGIRADALYAMTAERNPGVDMSLLFPGYSREPAVTVMEGLVDSSALSSAVPSEPTKTAESSEAAFEGLGALFAEVESVLDTFGGFAGSNSWVLGPSRTDSGGAILANDPHIGFSNPAVWYECHIRYGDHESYGVHLPLIPYPIIAHNRHKAWSMTMFENDDVDLYRETFKEDDPSKVMYRGEWTEVERWTETIKVAGAESIEVDLVITPHGPVITELLDDYEGAPLSIWWMYHKMGPQSAEAFHRVGRATNLEETQAAVATIEAPGLNVSYADSEGNIAWWAAAKIVVRPEHVNAKDVMDGASGRDEPLGYLDFADNPQLVNPPSGVIVTSNNMSSVKPVGSIEELEGYWQPTDRAGRILDLLSQQESWSLDELKTVQLDDFLRSAPAATSALLGYVADGDESLGRLSPLEREAYAAVEAWDFRHEVGSIGATVYHYWLDRVMIGMAQDEIGEASFLTYLDIADSKNMLKHVLADEASPLWDDVTTDETETAREVTFAALREAVTDLETDLGGAIETWHWGRVHTVTYGHILGNVKPLDRFWNIGPLPAAGTEEAVAKMSWDHAYKADHGASMRLLLDYAHYGTDQGGWFVLPTGNSGDMMSPHFDDQAEMYLRGEYRNFRISEEAIAEHAEHEVRLVPAGE